MMNAPQNSALKGAVIGAFIAMGIPFTFLWITSARYNGGGANIGVGLLFAAAPIYLPIAIALGWKMGKRHYQKSLDQDKPKP